MLVGSVKRMAIVWNFSKFKFTNLVQKNNNWGGVHNIYIYTLYKIYLRFSLVTPGSVSFSHQLHLYREISPVSYCVIATLQHSLTIPRI